MHVLCDTLISLLGAARGHMVTGTGAAILDREGSHVERRQQKKRSLGPGQPWSTGPPSSPRIRTRNRLLSLQVPSFWAYHRHLTLLWPTGRACGSLRRQPRRMAGTRCPLLAALIHDSSNRNRRNAFTVMLFHQGRSRPVRMGVCATAEAEGEGALGQQHQQCCSGGAALGRNDLVPGSRPAPGHRDSSPAAWL